MPGTCKNPQDRPNWLVWVALLGAFFTIRGYHCLDGDQAYRLPVYLHAADPAVYRDDPFVRSFDGFNPHRGSFLVIGPAARAIGLTAALALLFVLTFATAAAGVARLARAVWPESGWGVGPLAFGLVLATLAGNVGTNHLFEPILLDRQMALALGWQAIGTAVASPRRSWRAAIPVAGALVVHPTLGLQVALLLAAGWVGWAFVPRSERLGWRVVLGAVALIGLATLPGLLLNLSGSGTLLDGLPVSEFRRLSLEVQGPQHMLPHLWRRPQWLAWMCFPWLATLALVEIGSSDSSSRFPAGRGRLLVLVGLNLLGLGLAWFVIEWLGHLRFTLFQPFRMATVLRGLCLVVLAGHVKALWDRRETVSRTRAALLVAGLAGDWMLVVVTAFETAMVLADLSARARVAARRAALPLPALAWCTLALGLVFLSRHDTESGHWPLLAATGTGLVGFTCLKAHPVAWTRARLARVTVLAWVVPLASLAVIVWPDRPDARPSAWRVALLRRCRFAEVPVDDIERLALWCRTHTPADARFVGPPGPKTFRLWSRRSLAFNRAGSPYNARGLADWAERFRAHVAFRGTLEAFVSAYLRDRHGLEERYDQMGLGELADLADRQGATFVIAARPVGDATSHRGLELWHVVGRWAVYRRVVPSEKPGCADGTSCRREPFHPQAADGSRAACSHGGEQIVPATRVSDHRSGGQEVAPRLVAGCAPKRNRDQERDARRRA